MAKKKDIVKVPVAKSKEIKAVRKSTVKQKPSATPEESPLIAKVQPEVQANTKPAINKQMELTIASKPETVKADVKIEVFADNVVIEPEKAFDTDIITDNTRLKDSKTFAKSDAVVEPILAPANKTKEISNTKSQDAGLEKPLISEEEKMKNPEVEFKVEIKMEENTKAEEPVISEVEALQELTEENVNKSLLMEIAWEVCNQVGGIYTVIQTKVPATKMKWGDNYLLLGPYFSNQTGAIFEYDKDLYNEEKIRNNPDPVKEVVRQMHSMGYDVHYGTWLIDGRPKAILFNPQSLLPKIHEHKYIFWEHHNITLPGNDYLVDQVVSFGFMVYEFIKLLSYNENNNKQLIAHFHEWMAGIPIPELRRHNINIRIVFTTHATMLGRYLAMNDPGFYDHLPFYDWEKEASHFNIAHIVQVERAASHGAHIFSTVSDITANECKYLLGREPQAILPNGLNIKRFEVMHEFQQIHKQTKGKINEFVMGHFFHNYTFDLDKTLYFFTSGRFEYFNKGFDLTLEALARLNWMMKSENIDKTVVMFFITKNPFRSINSSILESRAKLEEIRRNCDNIQEVLAEKLFNNMLSRDDINELPNLNDLVDDYLALRLRRNLGSWRDTQMPAIVTHDLVDEGGDAIMNFLKTSHLLNYREDKVKVVYHPDFVSTANPLFRMDYLQFVRGCHLGVFPSYYEPWGYTPLECCASGLPSITTDLAGFGSYVKNHVEDSDEKGLWVINRRNRPAGDVADDIAKKMFDFVKLERRERIALRNRIENNSTMFGWRQLRKYYDNAYAKVLKI
ncbi:MAG: glycosyltransferase [Bacteroidales bacterium]|nr:glycosyltransferase [Bacteroidales bacterium]